MFSLSPEVVGIDVDAVVACQPIELLLDLCGRQLVGAHIVQIVGSDVVAVVVLVAELIAEGQREESVVGILLVEKRQALLHIADGEVAAVVDKLGLDGLHLRLLDVLDKLAHQVAVCGNGRDGRFVNLLLQRVDALLLVDHGIAVAKEAACEIDHLLLGHLLHAADLASVLLPRLSVDEGIHVLADAPAVVVECALVVEFLVVDHRFQKVVGKASGLQVV